MITNSNNTKKSIMIVGYGSVGQYLLDYLLNDNDVINNCSRIIVASRKTHEQVAPRLNTSLVSSSIFTDKYLRVEYEQLDVIDSEEVTRILDKYNPDLLCYCARYISGVKYGSLSYKNDIGYGAWMPLAVAPLIKLYEGISKSKSNPKVIVSSFPDATVPYLHSLGYEVFTGAGNLNHLIPRLKMAFSDYYESSIDFININLSASHYLNTYVSKEGTSRNSDYRLTAVVGGKFISSDNLEDKKDIENEIFPRCKIPMESGKVRNLMISSDIHKICNIVLTEDSNTIIHLPGVNGLIGGYPCYYSKSEDKFKVIFDSPEILRLSRFANHNSLACDGIVDISNGQVTFTDKLVDDMKSKLGITYPKIIDGPEEMLKFARDLKFELELKFQ